MREIALVKLHDIGMIVDAYCIVSRMALRFLDEFARDICPHNLKPATQ
jgi:hypothetical protein